LISNVYNNLADNMYACDPNVCHLSLNGPNLLPNRLSIKHRATVESAAGMQCLWGYFYSLYIYDSMPVITVEIQQMCNTKWWICWRIRIIQLY